MAFTSKNLYSHKSPLTFLKGATLFFLGMSVVMFMTQAFEIVPSVKNARQYIQDIIFTTDGYSSSVTTVTIDGAVGDASFAGTVTGAVFCLEGDDCITERPEGGTVVGGDSVWMTGASNVAYYNQGNVGIGTDAPTEDFQVGNYFQIGKDGDAPLSTGGNFLRINYSYVPAISDIFGGTIPARHRNPNIQLNSKSGPGVYPSRKSNRKIENDNSLKFDYATGSYDYDTKLSLSSAGLMTLDGNIALQTGGYIKARTGTTNTNQLYLDYNGRVGIGTGTPQAKFHITKPVWEDQYLIKASLDDSSDNRFWVHDGGDTYIHGWLGIGINPLFSGGNTQKHALLVNGTSYLSGKVGIGKTIPTAKLHVYGGTTTNSEIATFESDGGILNIEKDSNAIVLENEKGYTTVNSHLEFRTATPAGSVPSYTLNENQLFLHSSGNVGIGTDSPGAKLHVKTPAETIGRVALFEAGGSTAGQMEINGGEQSQMMIRTMKAGTDLKFGTFITGAGTFNDYQLYLNDDGNVGIGRSNPLEKLHIEGNLRLQSNGSIYFSSNDWIEFTDGTKDGYKFMYDSGEKMRLTAQGRLGIGESNPDAMLSVNGGIRPARLTSDPCGTTGYTEGTIFYNNSDDIHHSYMCFCNYEPKAKKMHNPEGVGSNCEF